MGEVIPNWNGDGVFTGRESHSSHECMNYLINTEDGDHTHLVAEYQTLEEAKKVFMDFIKVGAEDDEIAIELVTEDYEPVMYHNYATGVTEEDA